MVKIPLPGVDRDDVFLFLKYLRHTATMAHRRSFDLTDGTGQIRLTYIGGIIGDSSSPVCDLFHCFQFGLVVI